MDLCKKNENVSLWIGIFGNWVSLYVSSVCFDLLFTSVEKLLFVHMCVLIFCAFYLFFLCSQIYNLQQKFDEHCKTTGRISRMKCWKRWAFTTYLSFLKEDHPEISKIIDISVWGRQWCIQRLCFTGNLIWVQIVIWMQIPSTFKKSL